MTVNKGSKLASATCGTVRDSLELACNVCFRPPGNAVAQRCKSHNKKQANLGELTKNDPKATVTTVIRGKRNEPFDVRGQATDVLRVSSDE